MRSLTRRLSRQQPSNFVLVFEMTTNQLTTPWPVCQIFRLHSVLVRNAASFVAHSLYSGIIRKGNVIPHVAFFKIIRKHKFYCQLHTVFLSARNPIHLLTVFVARYYCHITYKTWCTKFIAVRNVICIFFCTCVYCLYYVSVFVLSVLCICVCTMFIIWHRT